MIDDCDGQLRWRLVEEQAPERRVQRTKRAAAVDAQVRPGCERTKAYHPIATPVREQWDDQWTTGVGLCQMLIVRDHKTLSPPDGMPLRVLRRKQVGQLRELFILSRMHIDRDDHLPA